LFSFRSGIFFAFLAAFLNSTIAIFSKFLLLEMDGALIAFYRALLGVIILWFFFPRRSNFSSDWRVVFICAFFGIFCLFFFETNAYQHDSAANVVFSMMACAALSAFALESWFTRRLPLRGQLLGIVLCLLGLIFLFDLANPQGLQGVGMAALAGLGYGLFTVLAKRWGLGSGIFVTRSLLMAGSIFLFFPAAQVGFVLPSQEAWVLIALLAVVPSMLGFYCTIRAVSLTSASKVQVCELSEPVFVMIASLLIFHEQPTVMSLLGAAVILIGIYQFARS